MHNLRLIPINCADAAILSATSAVLPVENLQAAGRTNVWRAAGTSAVLSVSFPAPATIDSVAVMTSNLTPDAFWRIRFLGDVGQTLYDSTSILACPPKDISEVDWGYEPLGVNAFAFGVAAQSIHWLPNRFVASAVQIEIDNPTNPAGYIEASRLIIGAGWSPEANISLGCIFFWEERGLQKRAGDGFLRSEAGAKFRKIGFGLEWLSEGDRKFFAEMAFRLGTSKDFLVSVYPDAGYFRAEHYCCVAKFVRAPGIARHSNWFFSSNSIEIEEV
ncbi:MAG: hypothetical protein WC091_13340 [Sulfuricellaceae bacterium]